MLLMRKLTYFSLSRKDGTFPDHYTCVNWCWDELYLFRHIQQIFLHQQEATFKAMT